MNECHFIGRLLWAPKFTENKSVPHAEFSLLVERQFKRANGTACTEGHRLEFEVWDTAAVAIAKCKQGELLIIDRASACRRMDDSMFFRVDKFSYQSTLFGQKNDKKTSDTVDG